MAGGQYLQVGVGEPAEVRSVDAFAVAAGLVAAVGHDGLVPWAGGVHVGAGQQWCRRRVGGSGVAHVDVEPLGAHPVAAPGVVDRPVGPGDHADVVAVAVDVEVREVEAAGVECPVGRVDVASRPVVIADRVGHSAEFGAECKHGADLFGGAAGLAHRGDDDLVADVGQGDRRVEDALADGDLLLGAVD